jgi:predicted RNA-binding protein Jag
MLKTHIHEPVKVHIEVNDYLKSKDDRLKNYILAKIKIVEDSGRDLKLPFFSSYERKKIHSIV